MRSIQRPLNTFSTFNVQCFGDNHQPKLCALRVRFVQGQSSPPVVNTNHVRAIILLREYTDSHGGDRLLTILIGRLNHLGLAQRGRRILRRGKRMEGKPATVGAHVDIGPDTIPRQILWEEMRLLGYVDMIALVWPSRILTFTKVGLGSWNGSTQSQWKLRVHRHSREPVL